MAKKIVTPDFDLVRELVKEFCLVNWPLFAVLRYKIWRTSSGDINGDYAIRKRNGIGMWFWVKEWTSNGYRTRKFHSIDDAIEVINSLSLQAH